ncbi:SDR family oxidoreductase [Rhizobium straminoryzae]|uniref:SDR family oxidoreductase n=1 Tax=Rhizobium straminoryzae TaxID=1387186 RepID=A0A549TGZ2_9HYPH|nr:SDR family oxidoreductase [Rhizobium straminoryzae]TRL42108.1 SDR family oxidoreductase [Rhizobium straminoryzae]
MSGQSVALVTGAATGIGAAIARRLAQSGFAIVASDITACDETVRSIQETGGNALSIEADIASEDAFARRFDHSEDRFGGVDVLVNNAGIMIRKPMVDITDAEFDRQIAVNLTGTFRGLREAARRLRSGGRIISISSSVATMASPNYSIYAATKSAVETMTSVLAKELRGRNITVNAVAPGATATDLFLTDKSPEAIEAFARLAPLERIGTPGEIAFVVAFLAGPEGAWINGQTIHANGGVV